MSVSLWVVFVGASITALATGLGALPFAFVRSMSRSWLGLGAAAAAGVMIGATVLLLTEGVRDNAARAALGALVGIGFIALVRYALRGRDDLHVGSLRGATAVKAIVLLAVMTAHSFAEGVGVGVAYGRGEDFGAFITVAIALHNIPEGLAISLVLIPRGVSVLGAAGWSIFSSLPQPLMAVPAFLFVEAFSPLLAAGLGFAAGAMLWLVAAELLPDAMRDTSRGRVIATVIACTAAMIAFQLWLLS